jgi:1,4-dihydroxy-2-naphthoate octaprenyltransferase
VLQGVALAATGPAEISLLRLVLVLTAALAAHILVNVLNEVADFRSGLDLHTDRTPFSGGSGTLPVRPDRLPAACALAGISLAILMVTGLWLVWLSGLTLLAFGALGLVTVLAYSGWLSRRPWLCLLAPGIGFGPCMLAASEYALAGSVSPAGWGLSTITGLLVSALLLINQLPDSAVDARFGRRHLAIVYGSETAAGAYLLLTVLAGLLLTVLVIVNVLPALTLLALLPFFLLIPIALRVRRHHQGGPELIPALAANVLLVNGALALIVLGLWIG